MSRRLGVTRQMQELSMEDMNTGRGQDITKSHRNQIMTMVPAPNNILEHYELPPHLNGNHDVWAQQPASDLAGQVTLPHLDSNGHQPTFDMVTGQQAGPGDHMNMVRLSHQDRRTTHSAIGSNMMDPQSGILSDSSQLNPYGTLPFPHNMASVAAQNSTFTNHSIVADHAFDNSKFRAFPAISHGNAGPGRPSGAGMNGQYACLPPTSVDDSTRSLTSVSAYSSPAADSVGSAPAVSTVALKKPPVQIPRKKDLGQDDTKQDGKTVHLGPASKNYKVPERVKPGRKPMTADNNDGPANKRKLQNRNAQRVFRDRRAQKVHDLEQIVIELNETMAALKRQMEAQQVEIESQSATIIDQNALIDQLRRELDNRPTINDHHESADVRATNQEHQSQNRAKQIKEQAFPTPPGDNSEPQMETDFTNFFSRPKIVVDEDHNMTDSPIGESDHCGFCTRPDNCLCRPEDNETQILPPISEQRAIVVPLKKNMTTTPSYLEAPTRATGPGSCDMCLADPEKARQCQEMARITHFSEAQSNSSSSSNVGNRSAAQASAEERMSCSDFLTRAGQVPLGPDIFGRVHVYPYARRETGGGSLHSPAMEIDAHDAAHALAEMSRGKGSG